jgi:flagellar biosynthesis/type III secretory pathway chaperone
MSSEFAVDAEVDAGMPPPLEVVEDDEAEAEPEPEKKAKPEKREPRAPVARESKAMSEMRNNEDRNLKDWMEEISPGGAIRVKVTRTSPKTWKGLNVGGALATYDHQIDEDWIRDHHGGGNFMLVVQKPRTNGAGWVYAGGRAIGIAGDPRTDDVFRDRAGEAPANGAANPANGIVDKTFSVLERELANARQQHVQHGPDTATMQMMMGPLQQQLDQLSSMVRDKDRQLAAAQVTKPVERDEFRDKMLDKLLDGDSARINSLRSQYESELRQVKQSSMDNESRLRDSFERDKQALAMSHERELNALRSAYDMRVSGQEVGANAARTLMEGEIRRLQADLSEAKAELVALRLKKEKGTVEMMTEMAHLREVMGEAFGDDKEKSTLDKALEIGVPALQAMLAKNEQQPATQQPPPQPQFRPRPQPQLMTGPDGNLYRPGPSGEPILVRERKRAVPPSAEGKPSVIPDIPVTTIKAAVDFLESAYRNSQDPSEVATSVRSMIPADVLTAIRELGIDGFLEKVAKLEGTSPLASQAGRNWSRKLGKSLLEG